jgi:hypothetical protein
MISESLLYVGICCLSFKLTFTYVFVSYLRERPTSKYKDAALLYYANIAKKDRVINDS